MPALVAIVVSLGEFLLKYFSFRAVKLALSIFFNTLAVSFLIAAFYFSLDAIVQVWSLLHDAINQANTSLNGSSSDLLSKAMAFANASGLLEALNRTMNLFFTVVFLIFARAAYELGAEAIKALNKIVQDALMIL